MTAPRPTTVPAYLLERVERSPQTTAFCRRTADGWQRESWQSIFAAVRALSGHLIRLGLVPGDRVAIMMPTCIEWEICHLAILAAGGVVVGTDSHDAESNIRHILNTVRPRVLFAGTPAQARVLLDCLPTPPPVAVVADETAHGVFASLQALLAEAPTDLDSWPRSTPDSLATIIFTSGSTGQPKGVAYTHAQLCLAGEAILERFPGVSEGARLACWLPLSNLFQRIINLCGMMRGAESWFVENPAQIVERLPEIRPVLLIGVPRFFEKLYAGIEDNLARRPAWVRQGVRWAREVGGRCRRLERAGHRPRMPMRIAHRIADSLFLARIRALMGPDLQFMISGSAPMPVWLLEQFHALGWLVLEAYGTSENVVPIAINTPTAYRFGSVGLPLPCNEVRIAEDGELLVRGPGVFHGYYGEPVEAAPLDADGYLHTGDLARKDEAGYIWLTGRKSEIFKTSTGCRVAPVPVEASLKRIPYVELAVVFGRGRPIPVALLCVDPDKFPGSRGSTLVEKVATDVARACAEFPARSRPAGILISRSPLTITGGELTSNLKLRRNAIEAKFRQQLDELYAALASGTPTSTVIVREAP